MAISYGFYNSKDGDRKYNASHLNTLFDGVIQDGVFQTIGNTFAVSPGSGLSVSVATGKCWFKNTWMINDNPIIINLDSVIGVGRSRIDAIVIDIDKRDTDAVDKRENSIKVVKGDEASSNPAKPDLIYTDNWIDSDSNSHGPWYQIPIAWVTLNYGDTAIEAADIENNVGMSYETETTKLKSCPYVMGAMQRFTVEQYVQQFEEAFDAWFQDLQNELDENQAAHLQHEIDTLISSGTTPLTSSDTLEEGKVYFQYEV